MKMIIGVTGGIASGKSNVILNLKNLGYPIIDSDAIARELQQKGESVYNEIVKNFGNDFLLDNGELDRKKLGKLIFLDEKARERLNSISHPLIISEIKDRIKKSSGFIFLDIPLLYETGLEQLCDIIVCVYVPYELQVERLMLRDEITEEYAKAKIASQMSLEKKKVMADYVIDSSGSFEETQEKLEKILKKIEETKNGTN